MADLGVECNVLTAMPKESESHPSIEGIRHSLAHLLAASVRDLYPGAKNAIGPAIENGFYQDFELPQPISDSDLPRIEKKMREILKTWKGSSNRVVTPEEARKEFAWNEYKTELINEFVEQGKELTFYTLGNFVDLCKGGHSENPAKDIDPGAFKLDKIAGAYWRGDATKAQLTRIYGLAFETKAELDEFSPCARRPRNATTRSSAQSSISFRSPSSSVPACHCGLQKAQSSATCSTILFGSSAKFAAMNR